MKQWILLGILILLTGCASNVIENSEFCGISTQSVCESDSDCVTDGCSGQICKSISDESYITTCEWKDCYETNGLKCECNENKCSWS